MTEDNIIFTGNRKTRRALKRERKKKAKRGRLENRREELVSKPVPHDINYISFTGTLKAFHQYNVGQKYSNYKLPIRARDVQKWAMLNIGAFFSPAASFFFGCKPEHLQLNSFSKYAKVNGSLRGHFRVPFELSRLGHPDLEPVPSNHKLTFKSLPQDLATTWTIFASAIIQACREDRVYFYDGEQSPWWHYTLKVNEGTIEGLQELRNDSSRRHLDNAKRIDNYNDLERHIFEINRNCCVVKDGKPLFNSERAWEDFEHSYHPINNRRWSKKELRNSLYRKLGKLAADDTYGKDWVSPLKLMRRDELRIMQLKAIQGDHTGYAKHRFDKIQRKA